MATLVETLRELAQKVDLRATVNEALNPPPVPVADVAYVYNGFDDLMLTHCGMYHYAFPRGQVTRIESKLDHKEIDHAKTMGREIAYTLLPMKGESIARELIESRGYTEKGLIVFTNGPTVPTAIKEEADEVGKQYKLREIERFKVGRDKARAGQPGFKLKPDPGIYRWMQEFNPDDEMFGEGTRKTEAATNTAATLAKLTELMEKVIEAQSPGSPAIRRKPLEKDEDYGLRLMEEAERLTKPKEAAKAK